MNEQTTQDFNLQHFFGFDRINAAQARELSATELLESLHNPVQRQLLGALFKYDDYENVAHLPQNICLGSGDILDSFLSELELTIDDVASDKVRDFQHKMADFVYDCRLHIKKNNEAESLGCTDFQLRETESNVVCYFGSSDTVSRIFICDSMSEAKEFFNTIASDVADDLYWDIKRRKTTKTEIDTANGKYTLSIIDIEDEELIINIYKYESQFMHCIVSQTESGDGIDVKTTVTDIEK